MLRLCSACSLSAGIENDLPQSNILLDPLRVIMKIKSDG